MTVAFIENRFIQNYTLRLQQLTRLCHKRADNFTKICSVINCCACTLKELP